MKKVLVILATVAVATAWFWYGTGRQWEEQADRREAEEISPAPFAPPPAAQREIPDTEGGPETDELSLPAFSRQDFSGRDFKVGRILAENEAYTRYYITYSSNGLKISGIMNVPKGEGPFPLVVLNHGYIDPAVYTNGRGLKREQDYLARQGYAVVHPDYRNHAESDDDGNMERRFRLGYAEDVINAIWAIKAAQLPKVDTSRIGMLGHSMGGGVAWRMVVVQPDLVKALVQFAPVSADERDNFAKWTTRRPETAAAIVAEHGRPEENPEFWDNISPLTFFQNVSIPVMVHHGTADDSVPVAWSERAAGELEAQGKEITLHVYPGEPHEFIDAWPLVMQRTTAFFDQYLKS